jgi:hypothetical protein
VKEGNVRLLSPQHWGQTQGDTKPVQGTGSETVADKVTLFWKQQKHRLTIPLSHINNVVTFNLAPGYTQFMGFCTKANVDYAEEQDNPIICLPAQAVSNDGGSGTKDEDNYTPQGNTASGSAASKVTQDQWSTSTRFNLDGRIGVNTPIIIKDKEDHQPTNLTAELLQYHHRFGHMHF